MFMIYYLRGSSSLYANVALFDFKLKMFVNLALKC